MPIVDAHCHVWDDPWPPLAPQADTSAGQVHRLLGHMDACEVNRAVIVAHLDEHDPRNNERALGHARAHPDRLSVLANVHLKEADALERAEHLAGQPGLVGISYYLAPDDDAAWMTAEGTRPVWELIAELGLAVNLSLTPSQQAQLGRVAEAYPRTPFLVCHMGGARAAEGMPSEAWLTVLENARHPNVYVKVSGFAYVSESDYEYPFIDAQPFVRMLAESYGPDRLLWGSDYPVHAKFMTYRQTLEIVRTHCPFLSEDARAKILGENAAQVLKLS